jgi:hypothetical protein
MFLHGFGHYVSGTSEEKLSEKNIYASPFDWAMCFWKDWP